MWEQKKSKHPTIILCLEYEEFASIEIEKILKGSIPQYTINVDVYNIINDSVILYDLKDVEKALNEIKKSIEELYEDIPLMNDDEITSWVEEFQDCLAVY